jgi:fumarate hydratase class II
VIVKTIFTSHKFPVDGGKMENKLRKEADSLGEVQVPKNKLWGAQTQRSLKYFNIGEELIPREMIESYGILKKAAAIVNYNEKKLNKEQKDLIVQVCDEILNGEHQNQFPLHVWMTGSGTHFNMNINEVISNRCSQLAGKPLGSKIPVHPNDHINMSQSSNDTFPTAMNISTAKGITGRLIPSITQLRDALGKKSDEWKDIIKVGRTHMQDATPITLGQEFSGYVGMLDDNLERLNDSLKGVYKIALGGTAVGTGINSSPEFGEKTAEEIAKLTKMPFITANNKFAVQGSHDDLVMVSGALKTLATSLFKISNDIRLLSCGPRCGFNEINIPSNEPGSSIMPGKINPTQCEALAMISVQVMANDMAVTLGGAGGYLEMNVYKPLMIHNIMQSIRIMVDGCHNFTKFLVEGMTVNEEQINYFLERSLMVVTALSPVIGYDKASNVAHYALENDLTIKEAALKLNYISKEEFERVVDPLKMTHPNK